MLRHQEALNQMRNAISQSANPATATATFTSNPTIQNLANNNEYSVATLQKEAARLGNN